jgi:excisionase family DNA binding protein
MDEHRLLTVREVARALGVSEVTVRRRIETGELPARQLGGPGTSIRVDAGELQAWLDADPPDAA